MYITNQENKIKSRDQILTLLKRNSYSVLFCGVQVGPGGTPSRRVGPRCCCNLMHFKWSPCWVTTTASLSHSIRIVPPYIFSLVRSSRRTNSSLTYNNSTFFFLLWNWSKLSFTRCLTNISTKTIYSYSITDHVWTWLAVLTVFSSTVGESPLKNERRYYLTSHKESSIDFFAFPKIFSDKED